MKRFVDKMVDEYLYLTFGLTVLSVVMANMGIILLLFFMANKV